MVALKKRRFKKKQMITTLITVLVLASIMQNKEAISKIMPSSSDNERELLALRRDQKRLQRELIVAADQQRKRTLFKNSTEQFWIAKRDGEPETKIHATVEAAAKFAGVKLRVLGNLRRSKVCDGIVFLEFNIATTAPMKSLSIFIDELEKKKPRFYWQRLSMRPAGAQAPDQVLMNGNLRFFVINDDHTASYLLGGE